MGFRLRSGVSVSKPLPSDVDQNRSPNTKGTKAPVEKRFLKQEPTCFNQHQTPCETLWYSYFTC